jgi:hypothetical protein
MQIAAAPALRLRHREIVPHRVEMRMISSARRKQTAASRNSPQAMWQGAPLRAEMLWIGD